MNNWIKVSDRLPKHFDEVIVLGVSYDDEPIVSCGWLSGIWSGERWNIYSADFCESQVTHWMPLPQPPK